MKKTRRGSASERLDKPVFKTVGLFIEQEMWDEFSRKCKNKGAFVEEKILEYIDKTPDYLQDNTITDIADAVFNSIQEDNDGSSAGQQREERET